MAGMGLLFSALSGAGNSVAEQAQQRQKLSDQSALDAERSKLEEEKLARLDELKRGRDRSAQVTQAKDIDAATMQIQNERDAANINAANGSQMTAEDAAVLRNNPAARKAYGLLDSTRQSDLEDRASGAQKAGYLDAAREVRGELQTELNNQRYDAQTKDANRRMDIQEKFNQERAKIQDKLAGIQEARANRIEAKNSTAMDKAELQSTRMAISSVLKDIGTQEDKIQTKMLDPMLSDQQRAAMQKQFDQLDIDRKQARNELMKLAGVEPSKEEPKQGKTGWDSASGDVFVNGKKVGSAKNETDARSMASGKPVAAQSPSVSAQPQEEVRQRRNIDIAARDTEIERFNRANTGGTRESNVSKRGQTLASEFDNKISDMKSKTNVKSALIWFSDHLEDLTPAQQKQYRDTKKSSGIL